MRDVSPGRLTVSITNTARRFDELRGHGGQLMGHSPVTIVIVFHVHSIASRLVSIARDPGSDVQWTVAKLNTFAFTRPKKANSVAIHDSKITQFQDDGLRRSLHREKSRQLPQGINPEPTAHREDDFAIDRALYFQHRSSLRIGCATSGPVTSC